MLTQELEEELYCLDAETFEVEDLTQDDGTNVGSICSCSCSCSSCCSTSCSISS